MKMAWVWLIDTDEYICSIQFSKLQSSLTEQVNQVIALRHYRMSTRPLEFMYAYIFTTRYKPWILQESQTICQNLKYFISDEH